MLHIVNTLVINHCVCLFFQGFEFAGWATGKASGPRYRLLPKLVVWHSGRVCCVSSFLTAHQHIIGHSVPQWYNVGLWPVNFRCHALDL